MPQAGYFIDANLLVLLVVGSVGQHLIAKHRRLQSFTKRDYAILLDLVGGSKQVYVTPNTLTETSNLLIHHKEPERSRFLGRLRMLIKESREIVVISSDAAQNDAFERLGLTDAVLLETVTAETPLVTVDFDLYHAALLKGENAAVNFSHLRFE